MGRHCRNFRRKNRISRPGPRSRTDNKRLQKQQQHTIVIAATWTGSSWTSGPESSSSGDPRKRCPATTTGRTGRSRRGNDLKRKKREIFDDGTEYFRTSPFTLCPARHALVKKRRVGRKIIRSGQSSLALSNPRQPPAPLQLDKWRGRRRKQRRKKTAERRKDDENQIVTAQRPPRLHSTTTRGVAIAAVAAR